MLRFYVVLIGLLLSACVSVPPYHEKQWIENFVDTGQFNLKNINTGKILFVGSENRSYSNIDSGMVNALDNVLLNLLIAKYSRGNVLTLENALSKEAKFELSYIITNNNIIYNEVRNDQSMCYNAIRVLSIQLEIKNKVSDVLEWGGAIEKKLSKVHCDSISEVKSTSIGGIIIESLVNGIVEGAFDAALGTYPQPPEVGDVVRNIFHGYFENMPSASIISVQSGVR